MKASHWRGEGLGAPSEAQNLFDCGEAVSACWQPGHIPRALSEPLLTCADSVVPSQFPPLEAAS